MIWNVNWLGASASGKLPGKLQKYPGTVIDFMFAIVSALRITI